MKIWFKRIVISLVVLVIVALVGLAIFLLTFNPNAYKTNLQNLVFQKYQRTLTINGDIELSLFPRIGLSVKDVSLSNQNASDTFVSIESARLAVAIWPLLSDRFLVDYVSVSGFRAWVTRDENGRFNFDDLTEDNSSVALQAAPDGRSTIASDGVPPSSETPQATQAAQRTFGQAPNSFHIDIAGMDLSNGEIHYYDALTSSSARLLRLGITTGRVTADQPFDVILKGQLMGDFPAADAAVSAQAVVQFSPAKRTYSAQRVNVQVSGKLDQLQAQTLGLRAGGLVYDAYARKISANAVEFQVQGELQGPHAIQKLDNRLQVLQLRFDRSQALFSAEKLSWRLRGMYREQALDVALDAPKLAISPDSASGEPVVGTFKLGEGEQLLGVSLSAAGLGGNAFELALKDLKLDSTFKQGARLVRLNLVSPARWQPFDEKGAFSALKGDVHIEDPELPTGEFSFPFIGSLQADWQRDELAAQLNAVLSASPLDLSIKATDFKNPHWVVALKSEKLDLDQLFPVPERAEKTEKTETPAASAVVPDSTGAVIQPVTHLDLSWLKPLNLTGTVALGELKTRNVRLSDLHATVKAANGMVNVSDIRASAYEGELSGALSASADNRLTAEASLKNLAIGSLLADAVGDARLAGTGSLVLKLETEGTTLPALEANLSGQIKGNVRDGAFKGINLDQTLFQVSDAIRAVVSGQAISMNTIYDPSVRTDFTSLDLDMALTQGQGTIKKLTVMAPLLRITQGSPASIDLVNDQLDILVNVSVVNTRTGQQGKDLADLRGIPVPIRISGPLSAPSYHVQWQSMSSKVIRQALQNGLFGSLSERLAEAVAGSGPEQVVQVPATETTPPRTIDPVRSLGDALKGLLR